MKIVFRLSVLLLLISCDHGDKSYGKYNLINNSNYSIVIKSFNLSDKGLQKTIMLNKNETWESEKFEVSEPAGRLLSPEYFLEGDSIRIEFDDEKVLTYLGSYDSRNVLYEQNYLTEKIDDKMTVIKFIFVDDDYENADIIM